MADHLAALFHNGLQGIFRFQQAAIIWNGEGVDIGKDLCRRRKVCFVLKGSAGKMLHDQAIHGRVAEKGLGCPAAGLQIF